MKRNGTAIWKGSLKEGKGTISTQSGILDKTQYSFKTRFEDGKGTNPEELIGAAHSGCFTMQLSANLTEEGFEPDELETKSEITFEDGAVKKSHLILKAKVKGIEKEQFEKIANDAKENCPISKLLDTEITLESELIQ
ncbi:OsmC family protein [Salegentibacter mishustinae]|jgi:osmotically inducible protein OsmC|uniref:Peroxiredoxin n=1 Tax=Salegentibacter mishustinae TaxID=270918 RepID=A0A0Q9ZDD8_9FLAO|nr:OsmC family protein [Salegentibacter mishustinae]KRG27166.1 peroxiredoxin [Salegentibacter mishustinae]MDX1428104.1 OsmC family protein [Salegentibacter mishustinae]MDX1720444.1 OsmC family protein [Salegentibacter mishustinae]PNW21400.1 peroxiredoxin [Salegentibacter mishustinae]PZX62658.1 osmotically inducible protein OsmC [Salegentibacter mishustinae]